MGYMRHHAIVITSWKHDLLQEAHAKAVELGTNDPEVLGQRLWEVTEITPESTNGYRSFFVAPDGSKEGWNTSDRGDVQRSALIGWMEGKSGYLDWVEVSYGGDDYDAGQLNVARSTTMRTSRDGNPWETAMSYINCPVSSKPCPYPVPQCHLGCVDSWDGDDGYDRKGDVWVWTGYESQRPDLPVISAKGTTA